MYPQVRETAIDVENPPAADQARRCFALEKGRTGVKTPPFYITTTTMATTTEITELAELESKVIDESSTTTEAMGKERDNSKSYHAAIRRFNERGLRVKGKKTRDDRKDLAKEARHHSSVGASESSAAVFGEKRSTPAVVKRNRPPPRSRHQVAPQPSCSYASIDDYNAQSSYVLDDKQLTALGLLPGNKQTDRKSVV